MTTARARTRRSPARAARQHSSPGSAPGSPQTRLPWWAAALPVLAFAVLLGLMLGGPEANAAQQQAGGAVLASVLERLAQALLG
jgi:hypothetical protein